MITVSIETRNGGMSGFRVLNNEIRLYLEMAYLAGFLQRSTGPRFNLLQLLDTLA